MRIIELQDCVRCVTSRCELGAIVCIIRQVRREEGDEGMIGPEEGDVEEEEESY